MLYISAMSCAFSTDSRTCCLVLTVCISGWRVASSKATLYLPLPYKLQLLLCPLSLLHLHWRRLYRWMRCLCVLWSNNEMIAPLSRLQDAIVTSLISSCAIVGSVNIRTAFAYALNDFADATDIIFCNAEDNTFVLMLISIVKSLKICNEISRLSLASPRHFFLVFPCVLVI